MKKLISFSFSWFESALNWIFRFHLPMPFGSRDCQGRNWKRVFRETPKQEIREFLLVFIDSFGFPRKEKLKLNPEDKILDIYQSIYPIKNTPDSMELETLHNQVLKKYGLELTTIWNEKLTLGELFKRCLVSKPG